MKVNVSVRLENGVKISKYFEIKKYDQGRFMDDFRDLDIYFNRTLKLPKK